VKNLAGTPYARVFLTQLTINAGLLSAAQDYGLVPAEIAAILALPGDEPTAPSV